jgi:pyruvate formate-lyase/glycerol dehydratase family glycyl radical enzyme
MTPKERISKIRSEIRINPKLCIERARLYTESYKSTESDPPVMRRAKAFEKVLREKVVVIHDGELIVGNPTSKRIAAPILPEIAWKWYTEVMFGPPGDPDEDNGFLTEAEKAEFRELLKYWDGRSLRDKWLSVLPDEYKDLEGLSWLQGAGNPNAGYYFAHCCPDFERILKKGIVGLIAEVDEKLNQLDVTILDDFQKIIYLNAMKISLNAVICWARRLSDRAADMAKAEKDPERKAELEKIAYICNKVPANPAETFYEALQSVWISYVAVMLEGWGPGLGFGRMDQYLYPYYRKDIDSGEITKEKTRELISLFYLKLNELLNPFPITEGKGGNLGTLSGVTIGGASRDGTQDAEELSILFLEAEEDVCLYEDIAVRIHHSMSDAFVYRACQLATSVRGKIKFLCDETVFKQQMSLGRSYEMAREYASTGCFIHTIPGKCHDPGMDAHNLPMMLELALNNGVSRLDGKKIGAPTGDPRNFKTYEDLWSAYKKQVETVLPKCLIGPNYYQRLWATQLPSPLLSLLFEGCLERGLDILDGGTGPYATIGLWVTGVANVGDSLAAVKKAVFDDKRISMEQLINALDKNFEGEEEVLQVLKSAPKYGNDIDYVDNIVNDVIVNLSDELAKHRGHAGRRYTMAAGTVQYNIIFGMKTGALPDGRKAGEALGEGGISPYQGRNTSGATSSARSVTKLNLIKSPGGNVLNMKFDPSSTNSHAKMMNFVNFLRTFAETGGDLIQFNIISNEMLLDAQKHPENYRDLLVRVATYSAFFTDLNPMGQQEIIDRTVFLGF